MTSNCNTDETPYLCTAIRATLHCLQVALLGAIMNVQAANDLLEFDDPQEEQRYEELLEEIRCLVCQNQSLADSNASLAQDLRLEVHEQMIAGKSNEEIIDFLVSRYGEFVLYRPLFNYRTLLLWLGPLLLFICAAMFVFRVVKSRKSSDLPEQVINPSDRERLDQLYRQAKEE
ncbi:MAG TPA: cytochrome c-type biogenesis protein [Gammaproteobacteria bacterium]